MAEWIAKQLDDRLTSITIRNKKIPKQIIQILRNRGCDSPEKIERFFAPSLGDLYDPYLLSDMDKAVDRIISALENKEEILIHGDYDTDGITGCAILLRNLHKLGLATHYFIPNRFDEGYGLSRVGIDKAREKGCSLIITVDCGVRAINEVAHARENNIDVIVCDHHKTGSALPAAVAVLDPKKPKDVYPFKYLSGVGVAFKFLTALYKRLDHQQEELYEDLDLVAFGTVVDVVPLIDENRILVKYGIKKMLHSSKPGIQALLHSTKLRKGLTSYHLGFILGPRINACGRLRDAHDALQLFLTDNRDQAIEYVKRLSADNSTRQTLEQQIFNEAETIINRNNLHNDRVIVIGNDGWHEGVVGIVASKISESYYRPTILLSLKEKIGKGSARSIPGFDITKALREHEDLLLKYGGHSQAAGLVLERDKCDALQIALNEYANVIDDAIFCRKYEYDLALDLDKVTDQIIHFLKYFEPTGRANPQPVFYGQNFEIVGIPRVIKTGHLKFALRSRQKVFDAIAFGKGDSILDIKVGKTRINCLYSISEDSFFQKKKIVLKVKEMEIIK